MTIQPGSGQPERRAVYRDPSRYWGKGRVQAHHQPSRQRIRRRNESGGNCDGKRYWIYTRDEAIPEWWLKSRAAKANGAGIAADPTLTSAWAPCLASPTGEPAFLAPQGTLGARWLIPFADHAEFCPKALLSDLPRRALSRSASSPALAPASDCHLPGCCLGVLGRSPSRQAFALSAEPGPLTLHGP